MVIDESQRIKKSNGSRFDKKGKNYVEYKDYFIFTS